MIYLRLFYEFFKAGLFAVGGGLATLPFLQDIADTTGWFTRQQLADMIAVSESTPGPIGVNMATYVGFTTGGIPGSVIATLGLITPSIIVILIVAAILKRFQQNRFVQYAFYGLRPASVGLISAAFVSLITMSVVHLGSISLAEGMALNVDIKALILAVLLYVMTNKTKWHPGFFLLGSAIIGILFQF